VSFREASAAGTIKGYITMPRLVDRLTARRVAALVQARAPGSFADGEGLYLQVGPRGSASWVVVYRRGGKRRKMGLGPVRLVALAEARAKRDEAHKMLRLDGKDPLAHRALRARKQSTALTFKEAARRYVGETEAKRRDPKSLRAWLMTLLGEQPNGERTENNYCSALHELPIGAIDTAAVLAVLKPIWQSKPETASRLRGRIEKVIDYAIVHGLAGDLSPSHENPARWKGRLEHALPAKGEVREIKHHAALAYEDLPAFLRKLRTREGLAARALELAILTATRTGDLIGSDREERPPMRREHVDLAGAMWTVPKTKTGAEHRVPLSGAAVALLAEIFDAHPDDGSGIVFVGDRKGEPLSNGALLRVRDRMIDDGLIAKGAMTTHGLRASFKSWASDQTDFEKDVIEACLTHVIGDPHRRTDFYRKRARLMQSWADFVEGKAGANVVALRGA
jgi:integrase